MSERIVYQHPIIDDSTEPTNTSSILINEQGYETLSDPIYQGVSFKASTITSITTGINQTITVSTHNLLVGETVKLENTNTTPNIDGIYTVTSSDIVAGTFVISNGTNVTVAGDSGDVYYNSFVLTKAVGSSGGQVAWKFNPGTSFVLESEINIGGGTGADALYIFFYSDIIADSELASSTGFIIGCDSFSNDFQLRFNNQLLQVTAQDALKTGLDIDDGAWHKVKLIFDYGNIIFFYDGLPVLQYKTENTVPGFNTIYNKDTYIGIGGRTGAGYNHHLLRNLKVSKYQPGEISLSSSGNAVISPSVSIGGLLNNSTLTVGNNINDDAGKSKSTISLSGASFVPETSIFPGMYHKSGIGLGLFSENSISFEIGGSGGLNECMRMLSNGEIVINKQGNDFASKTGLGMTINYSDNTTFLDNSDIFDAKRPFTISNTDNTLGSLTALHMRTGSSGGFALDQKLVRTGTGTGDIYWSFYGSSAIRDIMRIHSNPGGTAARDHYFKLNAISVLNAPDQNTTDTLFEITTANNTETHDYLAAYDDVTGTIDLKFKLAANGNGTCDGSWIGGGADYAEYFEWGDGNIDNEDRRGVTVVLENEKIRKSVETDRPEDIIGVISGFPSVIGDSAELKWNKKYEKDKFNSIIYEDCEIWEWDEVKIIEDENTIKKHSYISDNIPENIVVPNNKSVRKAKRRKINQDYDETKEYIPRKDRKEWSPVGLIGKLRILKNQKKGEKWIKLKDIADDVEEWLVR